MQGAKPIPSFYLYGDAQRDEDLDTIHVEQIRERSMRHDWIIHPHVHPDHVQILWISEGGARFVIEGEPLVAGARSLVVQPAGALHEIRFETGTEGRVITVAVSYVQTVARDDPRLVAVTRTPKAILCPTSPFGPRWTICATTLPPRPILKMAASPSPMR